MLFEIEKHKKVVEREIHLYGPKGVIRMPAKAVLSRPSASENRVLEVTVQNAEVGNP